MFWIRLQCVVAAQACNIPHANNIWSYEPLEQDISISYVDNCFSAGITHTERHELLRSDIVGHTHGLAKRSNAASFGANPVYSRVRRQC